MKKRYATLPFILALGAGCRREPDPSPPVRLDLECLADYEQRGREVREALAACESDADCTFAQNSPECIAPFQCSQAIARGNDAAFEAAANQVVDDYIAECGNFCSVTDCVGPEQLRAVCDITIGQCVIEFVPVDGASVGEY